ncbi:MAG: sigma-70 family RNA polymerase sigma factor [Pleurocapsa sp.]
MSSEPPSHSCKTDADLFLLLQNGQTDILAILYDRHAALVYGTALRLLKNTTEAEDLTQDIFLILTKKCSYDPKRGTLRTYLGILTRSRALDRLRSRSRNQKRLHNQSLHESDKVLSESPMVEVSQVERSHEVQQALKQLSTQEQEVLRMAYYQDLSQSEIAKQLNIALGTVKSRSRRGLLKLRQALIKLKGHS